jgi:predicted anti-sigma-YlaC factor YlaD
MKCSQAQVMMQRRLDAGESVAGESAAGEEFAALDAHLRECSACSMAWLELLRSRALLGVVRSDAPTNEEVESMWQAIDASVATAGGMLNSQTRKTWPKPPAVARDGCGCSLRSRASRPVC